MSLSLGIDIGTSGIRTAIVDRSGSVISMARADHEPQPLNNIDADLWWTSVKHCISTQIKNLNECDYAAAAIDRILVDGTSGSMVLVDEGLRPVSRALMYNSKGFDNEARDIALHAPENHITNGSASALGRAMRLATEAAGSNVRHLLHQADFIAAKLMNKGGFSDHNNALKLGFDPEVEAWPDWLGNLVNERILPDPQPVGKPLGQICENKADELGLSRNSIVCAGTTDSIAAFFACADPRQGVAVTSIGSTLAVKCLSATRIDDPSIGLYSHRIGNFWLAGGASNTGGAVLANFFDTRELQRLSAGIDPDVASPLDYYPLLEKGERFPINDPNLMPKLKPRPESNVEFLHGLLEGIARIEDRCYREIENRGGVFPTDLFTAGGGSRNEVWKKIRRRVLGIDPQTSDHSEAAIGAAKLAYLHA